MKQTSSLLGVIKMKFNFNTIKMNSSEYGKDFHKQLQNLELFEENINSVSQPLNQTLVQQGTKDYTTSFYDQDYKLSRKAVSDILAKSEKKISIKSFDEVEALEDDRGLRLGTFVLNRAAEKTFRVKQKFALYDGEVKAVLNEHFPIEEGLKLNRLAENLTDLLISSGKDYVSDISFNVDTGNVSFDIMSNITELDIENINVNEEVAFGFSFRNNYYGSRRFSMISSTLNLACSNGMLSTKAIDNLDIVHSSLSNFAFKIGDWMYRNVNYLNLPNTERSILQWLRAGRWVSDDYSERFYNLFSSVILDTMERQQSDKIELIKAASARSIDDLGKELDKLQKQFKLPRSVVSSIENTYYSDDTIDQRHKNDYYLSMAISRYANEPSLSFERKEELQTIANQVLVRV